MQFNLNTTIYLSMGNKKMYFLSEWYKELKLIYPDAMKLLTIESIFDYQITGKEPLYLPSKRAKALFERVKKDLVNLNKKD